MAKKRFQAVDTRRHSKKRIVGLNASWSESNRSVTS